DRRPRRGALAQRAREAARRRLRARELLESLPRELLAQDRDLLALLREDARENVAHDVPLMTRQRPCAWRRRTRRICGARRRRQSPRRRARCQRQWWAP